jgi:hypothetical protein
MPGIYAEAQAEVKKMRNAQRQAKKQADNTERERKAADRRMKKYFQQKFKEFTRTSQTKISDKRTNRSVRSLAKSVLIPK